MRLFGITIAFLLSVIQYVTAQCGSFPVLDLGNDTTLCQGQTLDITAPSGYDYISWNIVSGTPTTVNISSPQTVILQVQNITTNNLVVNGDFEAGNTGFTTQYALGTGGTWGQLSSEGTYAINTNSNNVHTNFNSCFDHGTGSPGNMLIVNGSGFANTTVWEQTIAVDPNTDYNFSCWVMSVQSNSFPLAQLQFSVNGVLVGDVFSPTAIGCDWQEFFEPWNSGASTSATIRIVNQNTATSGNDFAVDDISFIPICIQTDTIVVAYDTNTISAGNDVAFCANEQESLTASASFANANLVWETGQTTATINPTTSGYYTVTTISPSGCILSDSALVDITPMPWNIDEVGSQPTTCGSNDGVVYVTTNGTFNDPPYYTWNGPGAGNPNEIDASVWQNLASGWYYIEIESDGCYRYDSVFVDISNPPVAELDGSPLSGYGPLTVDFTNTSTNATDYEWNFGNGNSTTATDNSGQQQTYTEPGTYVITLVANQGSCDDVATITVIVNEPPEEPEPPIIVPVDLSYPNVFTPNGDEVNDYFEFDLLNIKAIHIDILNRWGEVVYTSSDVNFKWDGKINGALATEGVYTFVYTATGAQEEKLEGQGFLHLVK